MISGYLVRTGLIAREDDVKLPALNQCRRARYFGHLLQSRVVITRQETPATGPAEHISVANITRTGE